MAILPSINTVRTPNRRAGLNCSHDGLKKWRSLWPARKYTWLVDLNRDGKQDLLMHHASTTEPHRVTMLIAQ